MSKIIVKTNRKTGQIEMTIGGASVQGVTDFFVGRAAGSDKVSVKYNLDILQTYAFAVTPGPDCKPAPAVREKDLVTDQVFRDVEDYFASDK